MAIGVSSGPATGMGVDTGAPPVVEFGGNMQVALAADGEGTLDFPLSGAGDPVAQSNPEGRAFIVRRERLIPARRHQDPVASAPFQTLGCRLQVQILFRSQVQRGGDLSLFGYRPEGISRRRGGRDLPACHPFIKGLRVDNAFENDKFRPVVVIGHGLRRLGRGVPRREHEGHQDKGTGGQGAQAVSGWLQRRVSLGHVPISGTGVRRYRRQFVKHA